MVQLQTILSKALGAGQITKIEVWAGESTQLQGGWENGRTNAPLLVHRRIVNGVLSGKNVQGLVNIESARNRDLSIYVSVHREGQEPEVAF